MNDNHWLTVTEVSDKVHIPVETIRRYIRSHNVHLRVKKQGKKYSIHSESMTVIETIRQLYSDGKNVDEVEESLSSSGIPLTITVKNNDNELMTVHVADELQQIKKVLEKQSEHMENQGNDIEELKSLLKMQIERHDQLVTSTMRSHLETQKQIASAASEVKKKWWEFWK